MMLWTLPKPPMARMTTANMKELMLGNGQFSINFFCCLPLKDHFKFICRYFNSMLTVFILIPLDTWSFPTVIKNQRINILSSKILRMRYRRCWSFASVYDLVLFIQYSLLGNYTQHWNISVIGSIGENFRL